MSDFEKKKQVVEQLRGASGSMAHALLKVWNAGNPRDLDDALADVRCALHQATGIRIDQDPLGVKKIRELLESLE